MNAPNVRSATVRLNAEVAKYMADMRMAGKVTDDAFAKIHARTQLVARDSAAAQKSVQGLARSSVTLDKRMLSVSSSMEKVAAASNRTNLGIQTVDRGTIQLGRSMDRTGNLIDKASGRLRLYSEALLTLGPGLLPLGAAGAVGVAGLAGLFTGATVGALGLAAATQGVSTALEAVNKARLDPTVKNIKAAREEMRRISPEAREWVARVQEVIPLLRKLRDTGAAGLFPGLTESIDDFERLEPILTRFMSRVGEAGGEEIADIADSLDSSRWRPFLRFLSREAPDAIHDVSQLVGDLAHGAAQLWVAFDPGQDKFVDWALDVADAFDRYASSEEGRKDIAAFIDYATENGPKVADFLGSAADAVTQLVQAAAPLGGPTLEILTSLLEVTANLADSDIATPVIAAAAAYTALSRAALIASKATALAGFGAGGMFSSAGAARTRGNLRGMRTDIATIGTTWMTAGARSQRETARMNAALGRTQARLSGITRAAGPAAATLGLLAVASGDVDDAFVGTNTSMGALIGLMAGGPMGAAAGAVLGNFLDIRASIEETSAAIDGDMTDAMDAYQDRLDRLSFTDPGNWLTGEGVRAATEDIWSLVSTGETATSRLQKEAGKWGQIEGGFVSWDEMLARHGTTMEEVSGHAQGLTGVINDNALALARQREAAKASRQAMRAAAEGFLDYSDAIVDGKFKLDEYLDALEKQLRAQANFDQNINTLRGRKVDESVIDALIEEGPAAARAVEHLANATDAELRRFVRSVNAGAAGVRNFGRDTQRELRTAVNAFKGLPDRVETDIKANGIPQTMGEVDRLVEKYKLTEEQRQALITLKDLVTDKLGAVLQRLRDANGASATTTITTVLRTVRDPGDTAGGPPALSPGAADGTTVPKTGRPYADRHWYLLADGEEVVSNRHGQADRHRPLLKAISANRLADGGTTGPMTPIYTRSRSDNEVEREQRRTAQGLKNLTGRLKEAEKAVDRERRQRDALVDRMKQVSSGISTALTSELGASGGGSPWSSDGGGTLAGNLAIIQGDTRDARRFGRLVDILKEKGFDGAALEDLLARGDTNEISSYASATRGQLRRFEEAFNERARLVRREGRQGADAALQGELREANQELREATRELRQIKAHVKQANKDRKDEHQKDRDNRQRGREDARRNGRGNK